jgi:nitrite reductase (NO-forming)
LKTRTDDETRRRADVRLAALAVGSVLVFVGVPTAVWWLVVAGATLVSAAVLWHAVVLVRDLKRALPGRFRICIRYYVAAAACVPLGAVFGATLALGLDDRWHANLLVAHTMTMLLGWVGLTVVGTLVTFWPTVLRTRMDDRAETLARQALPILSIAIGLVIAGSLLGMREAAAAGIVGYAVGLLWFGRCLIAPARRHPPREFAAASILAGAAWACVALVMTAVHVAFADDISLATDYPFLAGVWVVGFLLQLLTGALSYLLPSVLGGGPRVVRAAARYFDRWAAGRLVVINGGLLLWLLPLPSWAKVTVSTAVLAALALFLPLMIRGIRASVAERRRAAVGRVRHRSRGGRDRRRDDSCGRRADGGDRARRGRGARHALRPRQRRGQPGRPRRPRPHQPRRAQLPRPAGGRAAHAAPEDRRDRGARPRRRRRERPGLVHRRGSPPDGHGVRCDRRRRGRARAVGRRPRARRRDR